MKNIKRHPSLKLWKYLF